MPQLVAITTAKQKLLELARRSVELGESFVLLKDGQPVAAMIPFEEYESLLETLDILETEPFIKKELKAAEKQIAEGKFVVWENARSKDEKGRKKRKSR